MFQNITQKTNFSFNGPKQRTIAIATKRLSALLRGITSTHDGGFYCSSCFHSFRINKYNKE